MNERTTTPNRIQRMAKGGARPGAGAPVTTGSKNPQNLFTIRLPEAYARRLEELGGNAFLKQLVIHACEDQNK
jgi:hypothetical protein